MDKRLLAVGSAMVAAVILGGCSTNGPLQGASSPVQAAHEYEVVSKASGTRPYYATVLATGHARTNCPPKHTGSGTITDTLITTDDPYSGVAKRTEQGWTVTLTVHQRIKFGGKVQVVDRVVRSRGRYFVCAR